MSRAELCFIVTLLVLCMYISYVVKDIFRR